jgi:hypothetical protein
MNSRITTFKKNKEFLNLMEKKKKIFDEEIKVQPEMNHDY